MTKFPLSRILITLADIVAFRLPSRLVCPDPLRLLALVPPTLMLEPILALRDNIDCSIPRRDVIPAAVLVSREVSVLALLPPVALSDTTTVTTSFMRRALLSTKENCLYFHPRRSSIEVFHNFLWFCTSRDRSTFVVRDDSSILRNKSEPHLMYVITNLIQVFTAPLNSTLTKEPSSTRAKTSCLIEIFLTRMKHTASSFNRGRCHESSWDIFQHHIYHFSPLIV